MSDESIGYSEAVAELEQILEQLERPDVDVDVLARQVQTCASSSGCVAPASQRRGSRSRPSSPSSTTWARAVRPRLAAVTSTAAASP